MSTLDAAAVARLLIEIGQRTELAGDTPFKARAYYHAAEVLQELTQPLAEVVAQGKLRTLPGVGEAIAEKILKLHQTGTHPTLERLREQIPAGLLEMLRISGLGPKKVATLHQALHIGTLAELEQACRSGAVRQCKGLGPKLEARIREGLEFLRKNSGACLLNQADERLAEASAYLQRAHPDWSRFTPAGDLRRGCETVSDFSLALQTGPLTPPVPHGDEDDGAWHRLTFENNVRVYAAPPAQFGLALLFATGSAAHVAGLQAFAESQGLELTEKGLFRGAEALPCAEEAQIYAALGLPFIEPELREGRNELERARQGKLPRLLKPEDLRGILHCHTKFSDGTQALADAVETVRQKGFEYLGVTDHSQAVAYAGGMKEDRVREQQLQIDELNAKQRGGFRVFKGIEADILADGTLDYPEPVLRTFDFVIASVHSNFLLDERAQTARIVKALSNPFTTILGHPTGRLLLQRPGYLVNMDEILQACARHGVAVEFNANPHRMDLDWRWHQRALELGCLLCINPDAHRQQELDYARAGVRVARKGGFPPEQVLNCMDLDALSRYLERRKQRT